MSSEPLYLRDSELILGLARHLGAYAASPAKAALAQLEFAGHVFEMAWRLRGSGLSSAARVAAIGVEAGIGRRPLEKDVLPTLELLGWIEIRKASSGELEAVDEHVPPSGELVELADVVLDVALPTPVERAALVVLRETTLRPLVMNSAVSLASDAVDEPSAREALRHLMAVGLVRRVTADDSRQVVFNPNVWVGDEEIVRAALRIEDARVRREIGGLIEEIAGNPGLPEERVSSTEQRWVDFAVAQGLVQRSVVETTQGHERAFLFTPHLSRDPFGVAHGDPSGHVRQLVGSMIYATTFATHRLYDPAAFVRRLVREGEAGDASPIGTDYPMLETAGIVRVEPAQSFYKLVLLQEDVAEEALRHLEGRGFSGPSEAAALRAQRSYVHVEKERAKLAHVAPTDDTETRRLISALRDATAGRRFRGG